jgi:hypothetical protein
MVMVYGTLRGGGEQIPHQVRLAPVAHGAKPGVASGTNAVPMAHGSKPGVASGTNAVPIGFASNSIRYGHETNAGPASLFQKVREA